MTEETPVIEYVSKKEYLQKHASEEFYKNIKTCAIASYVMIGFNVLRLFASPRVILDIALLLGLTFGVHLKKSKVCAILLLLYGIINLIIMSIGAGRLAGWMWILIPVIYLQYFNKAEKEYKSLYGA